MAELPALRDLADPHARRAAVQSLGDVVPGEPAQAEAFLFSALGDDDYAVRQAAVRLAVRWTPAVGTDALSRALCDESSLSRRSAAMEAFGQLGPTAVDALARLGSDVRAGVRRLAVDALGLTRAPAAVSALSKLADDASPAVRAAALEGLSRVGGDDAALRVEDVVGRRDEPASVVLAGLLALDAMGRTPPASRLRPHLMDPLTAAPALRLLGAAGEAGPLVDVLAKGKGARRRAAAIGLSRALTSHRDAARAELQRAGELTAPLLELLAGRDVQAASAALLIAGEVRVEAALLRAAEREDRGLLLAAGHRAVAALVGGGYDAAAGLVALKRRATSLPAAGFIDELIDGARALTSTVPQPAAPAAPAAPARPPRAGDHGEAPRMTADDFRALATLFHSSAGLQFEEHTAYRLEARLVPRLRSVGAASWRQYLALLASRTRDGAEELAVALDRVTVHETYFFRERFQLDAFSQRVLPAFADIQRRGVEELLHADDGPVRVLSAGCSTGEEPWTLAILLHESRLFSDAGFEVAGIDLSPSSVAAAEQGRYGRRGFRGDMPPGVLERWFEQQGAQRVVRDELRERVRFVVGNLTDAADLARLGRFHAIFCRNVLIYLSDEARAKVIGHFYERLLPGGVLFLGHSESLLNMETGFRFLPLDRELVYVRPREGGHT
jgi:chemotaxis protein methyltransferase CheR